MNSKEEILESIKKLDAWITKNGWAGYDPYDIMGHPLMLSLIKHRKDNIFTRYLSYAVSQGISFSPKISRNLLRIKPQVIPKSMGLFSSAYLDLYKITNNEDYLHKAQNALSWLEDNDIKEYGGYCWGLPFDWQSVILIPKDTPAATVSTICGDAFWNFYRYTGEKKYLDYCIGICDSMLKYLNIDIVDNKHICFSYTPLDTFHIHNSNILTAEFLIRIGNEIQDETLISMGTSALNYSLEAQNNDGSFYYWSLDDGKRYKIPENVVKNIDHYHTGFILRSLYSVYLVSQDEKILNSLTRGHKFYVDNLLTKEGIPKIRPDSVYPVNIHSCAEAIFYLSLVEEQFPEDYEYALKTVTWTLINMQDKDGHFYYIKIRDRNEKMAYIRWGQAWMMRALSAMINLI